MNVADKELCKELSEVSEWDDTDLYYGEAFTLDGKHFWDVFKRQDHITPLISVPAYSADYLRYKVRNYDFTIVNLNYSTLSLSSDSLDDPDAAILDDTLSGLFCKFAIELFKQNILTKRSSDE